MDVKVPHSLDWHRVYPDMAREIRTQRLDIEAHKSRQILETPSTAYRPTSGILTGGNSVIKAPILSSNALLGRPSPVETGTVSHDPDEVIYISPTRRTT